MARPPKDRRAFDTANVPLGPTETVDMVSPGKGQKAVPVVTKHGGREADRKLDPAVFEGGKLTKSAKLTTLFRRAVALRLADWSIPDIAQELRVSPGVIVRLFVEYREKVDVEEIAARLDQIAVPLAVQNLTHGLLAGDKDYTLETLKGRGFFKRHSDGGDGALAAKELPTLRVEFISPAGAASVSIGSVGDVDPTLGKVVGGMAIPTEPLALAPATIDMPQVSGVPLAPDDAATDS